MAYTLNPVQPADRAIGDYWSQQFADMMGVYFGIHKFDKAPSPTITLPGHIHVILPDVWVLQRSTENSYCEVKHKQPNKFGNYGLEKYRFDSLINLTAWAKGKVLYVVHDYSLTGGKFIKINNPKDWFVADIKNLALSDRKTFPGDSLVNGTMQRVLIHYWNKSLWIPLTQYFGIENK